MSDTASCERRHIPPGAASPEEAIASGPTLINRRLRLSLAAAICAAGLASLGFFYSQGLTNIYGDAIAHMEGARRLWDSRTPGYAEIGAVWLPLFHILVSPLTLNDFLWRSGLAGGFISTTAFGISAWYLFRLACEINNCAASGLVAAAGFILCPSMLYLASTPLTEPLALMWSVLLVYNLFRYQQEGQRRPLLLAAVAAFLGSLTRYEGWNLIPFGALFIVWKTRGSWRLRLRRAVLFFVPAAMGPFLWLLHNAYRYGNVLDFYNGPYSARAIYAYQLATTGFRYPTDGSLLLSGRYYLQDLKIILGAWSLELALLGMLAWVMDRPFSGRRAVALLFLVSLPFYIQAMAHAAVPLYVPTLFPHTYYNLRYGIEMLPAVAILPSFVISPRWTPAVRQTMAAAILVILAGEALLAFRRGARELPIVKEGMLNTPCNSMRQEAVVRFLESHYDGKTILMAGGKWPCVMPETAIPYRQTITENNREYWRQLRNNPEEWVQWIIRGQNDSVDELMRAYPKAFKDYHVISSYRFPREENVSIYYANRP